MGPLRQPEPGWGPREQQYSPQAYPRHPQQHGSPMQYARGPAAAPLYDRPVPDRHQYAQHPGGPPYARYSSDLVTSQLVIVGLVHTVVVAAQHMLSDADIEHSSCSLMSLAASWQQLVMKQ